MNLIKQSIIGKIFIQYILAVTAFAVVASAAEASDSAPKQTKINTSIQAIQPGLDTHISVSRFTDLSAHTADKIKWQGRRKHSYSVGVNFNQGHAEKSWPLLTFKLQQGNVNLKMGTQYTRR